MTHRISTDTIGASASDGAPGKPAADDGFGNGLPGLIAIEGISILGDHDGILEDDLVDLLFKSDA